MIKYFLRKLGVLTLILFIFSCNDDGPTPLTVNFANAAITVDESGSVTIFFSGQAEVAGTFTVAIDPGPLEYGEGLDFYTEPAGSDESVQIPFSAGDVGVTLTVFEGDRLNIQEDEVMGITLQGGENVVVGAIRSATVTFTENFVAPGGDTELVAGSDFRNQLFFDMSKIASTSVAKNTWDIAFYSGDDFYVALNSAAGVMARSTGESIIENIDAEDSVGFAAAMVTNGLAPQGSTAWIDDPTGDSDGTAIGSIASQPTEVFVVKGASGLWQKMQFARASGGYQMLYGNIESTDLIAEFITKDPTNNFVFFSFTNGIVSVEPTAESWDISYSSYMSIEDEVPLLRGDMITINRSGTRIAPVRLDGQESYDNFTREDADALTVFSADVNAVGASWRTETEPGMTPSVREDRFFVLEDQEGNYYKMLFQSLTNASGERGFLSFTYDRL